MYVWYDGICNPCDFDYKSKLKIGNVKEKSIKEVWLGQEFDKLRQLHLDNQRNSITPCDRCNIY